jgi:hypothetical protein
MADTTSRTVAVFITSMGDSPESVREFIERFSARYKVPAQKMLALSEKLPARLGVYDEEKAKRLGIEIKKLGGDVRLKRVAPKADSQPRGESPRPVEPPPDEGEAAPSWLSHGASESQDELSDMTDGPAEAAPLVDNVDYSGVYDDSGTPLYEKKEPRNIGKYETKTAYSGSDAGGVSDEKFEKIKELYAGRKAKRGISESPVFKVIIVLAVAAAAYFGYTEREMLITFLFGDEWMLEEAYIHKINPDLLLVQDYSGFYSGDTKSTPPSGERAFVDMDLIVEGTGVYSIITEIRYTDPQAGPCRIQVEYAPRFFSYRRSSDTEVLYDVETTFSFDGDSIATIDEDGRFLVLLTPEDVGINIASVPLSEKDEMGNVVLLRVEGVYGDEMIFYGGVTNTKTEIMEWEAEMD